MILLALCIVLFSWTTLFAFMNVSGESMSPALRPGDKVLIFRWAYGLRMPGRGSAVVTWGKIKIGQVVAMERAGALTVKRVLAAPGDGVTVAHGRLLSAGAAMIPAEDQIESLSGLKVVPPDRLLVVGDRGSESFDSRHYGLVPLSALRGRILRVWPARLKPHAL